MYPDFVRAAKRSAQDCALSVAKIKIFKLKIIVGIPF